MPLVVTKKSVQAILLVVFTALAAWGGLGLSRLGDARSQAKAERELARIAGEGRVLPGATPEGAKKPAPGEMKNTTGPADSGNPKTR